MEVLYPKFPGNILICNKCGALLSYTKRDIYGGNLVYCPLCKNANQIMFYEGEVND